MKKTALQKAILLINIDIYFASSKQEETTLIKFRGQLKSLLPTEKEQIETAFDEGVEDGSETRFPSSGKEYFTNTYGE